MSKPSGRKICWVCGVARTINACDRCSRGLPTLTLWSPWGFLIPAGFKDIETRTHNKYRGLKGRRIAIHAGMKWDGKWKDAALRYMPAQWLLSFRKRERIHGRVICLATVDHFMLLGKEDSQGALIDCDFRVTGITRWGLFLKKIVSLTEPVQAMGQRGIWGWTPPPELSGFINNLFL